MDKKIVTVMAFSNLWEAEIVKARLGDEGIPAFLMDGHTVNMNWLFSNAVGGVKVQVAQEDLSRARQILSRPLAFDGFDDTEPETTDVCPRCDNEEIEYEIRGRKWTYLTWLFFSFPLIWPRKRLFCSRCGHRWSKG